MNVKQKNWTNADYISSYVANGVQDYVILQNAINTHNTLSTGVIQIMLSGFLSDGAKTTNELRSGTFKVTDPDGVDDILFFAEKVFEIIGLGNGRQRIWASVVKFIYYCDKIDKIRFMKQLSAYHVMLSPVATIKQCLTVLERIYNYNYSKKNKVYFIPEYEKATMKTIR
jgi:hypothetical protein